jgi:uncharacterized protein (DUF302 family)
MVSARGGKYGFVYRNRQDVYRALRRKGMTKQMAAQISNAGHTKAGRKIMARKAAISRKTHTGKIRRGL